MYQNEANIHVKTVPELIKKMLKNRATKNQKNRAKWPRNGAINMKEFWGDMDLGALLENDIKDPTERDLLRSQAKNNFSYYKKKGYYNSDCFVFPWRRNLVTKRRWQLLLKKKIQLEPRWCTCSYPSIEREVYRTPEQQWLERWGGGEDSTSLPNLNSVHA